MIKCPSATRQRTVMRSVSSDACTTRRRFATMASTRSAGAAATARSAKQALHLVEDLSRDLVLGRLRDRALTVRTDDGNLVVARVEADIGPAHVIEDEEVRVLGRELRAGALEAGLPQVGGETDEHLSRDTPRAKRGEHVGRGLELDRPSAPVLRPLRGELLGRPIVG